MQISVTYTIPGILTWFTVSSGGSSIGTGSPFNPVPSGLANTNTPGTTTFYAECSTVPGCRTATNFVINPTASLNTVTAAAVCENSPAQVNLTGLVASSTATVSYTIGVTAYSTSVTADASGNASFNTISLTAATHNGQTLEITSINITSATPNCSKSFTGKTVTLVVNGTGTWLGVDNNWYNAANWCGGVRPY
jgi:hypothetical protein